MASELRDLLLDAAAEPADAFDVHDLRRRGRRARRRRRLATASGAASIVVLLAAGVLLGVGQLTDVPDVSVEDGRTVLPDVARQVVAEGTFGDGLEPWTVRAWTQNGDELCLQGPVSSTCGRPNPVGSLFLSTVGSGERDGVPVGCAVGATQPRVTTVELVFAEDATQLLTPAANETFGLRFYGVCWTGQRSVQEVNGLNDEGRRVASVGYDVTAEATESAEPPPQSSPWCPQVAEVVAQRHGGRDLISAVSSTVGAVRTWQARPVEPVGDVPPPESEAQPWLQQLDADLQALVCVYATDGDTESNTPDDGEYVSIVVAGNQAWPYQIFDGPIGDFAGPPGARSLTAPES